MKQPWHDIALQVGGSHYPDVGGELLTKFGESVIEQCCTLLADHVEVALTASGDVVDPEQVLRQHFGIAAE